MNRPSMRGAVSALEIASTVGLALGATCRAAGCRPARQLLAPPRPQAAPRRFSAAAPRSTLDIRASDGNMRPHGAVTARERAVCAGPAAPARARPPEEQRPEHAADVRAAQMLLSWGESLMTAGPAASAWPMSPGSPPVAAGNQGNVASRPASVRLGQPVACTDDAAARSVPSETATSTHEAPVLKQEKPPSPDAPPPPKEVPPTDRTLNIGTAIRVLREDLRHFLADGLTDTSIYARNIVLREPTHTKIRVRGHQAYVAFAESFRNVVRAWYAGATFELTKLQQVRADELRAMQEMGMVGGGGAGAGGSADAEGGAPAPEEDLYLLARWTLEGTPRYALLIAGVIPDPPARAVYEGLSVYRFDAEGKVAEHVIVDIQPAPPLFYRAFGRFTTPASPAGTGAFSVGTREL